jgi:hypothetical protein
MFPDKHTRTLGILEARGFQVGRWGKELIERYNLGLGRQVAVLSPLEGFETATDQEARRAARAVEFKAPSPNVSLTFLASLALADGKDAVTMHQPLEGSDGRLRVLVAHVISGQKWIDGAIVSDRTWRNDTSHLYFQSKARM